MKTLREMMDLVESAQAGVAEGSLNEFAPDGFNSGDDGEEFNPRLAKMAYDAGFVKGVSLTDAATTQRAMAINNWDKHDGGIYAQYFAKGFIEGRKEKIRHDNKQYNLNLKLMKDGSIRHGEQGVAEGSEELYQQAIRKYVQRVANDYLGGGNEYLYGANKFDSEMFGVDPKQAEQDFDRLFSQLTKPKGVAEEQVEESTPDALAKIDDLFRK